MAIRTERSVLLRREGGKIHRVESHTSLEIIDDLLRETHAHRLLGFFGGAADMGRGNQGFNLEQRIVGGGWLVLKNVQRGAGELARFQRFAESLLIDQFAARAVE